ncbi:hypothetical protein [Dongia sp. agr-C8]
MFPIFSNMPANGALTVFACAVGFGLFGWVGAIAGVLSVFAFFLWLESRRARREDESKERMID